MAKVNPADKLKDTMWYFLMTGGQKADFDRLKDYVYQLIQITTQKTGGQENYKKAEHINFAELDMIMFSIVVEATALVLDDKISIERKE